MSDSGLVALLSDLAAGKGTIPLSVSIKEDEEVQRLKAENEALRARILTQQSELERVSYRFRCESILNNSLVDVCRAHGIQLDQAFFARPYSEEKQSL